MQQPGASTSATTSRAVQLESFGGPEVLNLREVPAPQAGLGADPRASHRGWTEPDGLVHDLRRRDRHQRYVNRILRKMVVA